MLDLFDLAIKIFAIYGAWRALYSLWRNYLSPIPAAFPGFDKGNFVFSLPSGLYGPIVQALQRSGWGPSWNASSPFAKRAMWRNSMIVNAATDASEAAFGPGKAAAITRTCLNPDAYVTKFVNNLHRSGVGHSAVSIKADFDPEVPKGSMIAVVIDDCPIIFIFRKVGIKMGNPPRLVRWAGIF